MRNLLAVALLLTAQSEAGTLRRSDEGFEVVGGSPMHESFELEHPRRELLEQAAVEEEEEEVVAKKEYVDESLLEYVSSFRACLVNLLAV
jgi:hypothetical protein